MRRTPADLLESVFKFSAEQLAGLPFLPGAFLAFTVWLALGDHDVVPGDAASGGPGCASSASDANPVASRFVGVSSRMSCGPLVLGYKLPGDFWDHLLLAIFVRTQPEMLFGCGQHQPE